MRRRDEAATAALELGLREVDSVVSLTARLNLRSQRVMRRIGMRLDGTFEHPHVPANHPLRPHVLFRADAATWSPPATGSPPAP